MVPANTHLIVSEFELFEPETVQEAVAALSQHAGHAALMAGGTDLLVQMKLERRAPTVVVSLARIPMLARIEESDGLTLGAMASIRAIAQHRVVREAYTALAQGCRAYSTMQMMEMGTLGGNLGNASPASDTAPALLAFDASVRVASVTGTRECPVEDLFSGPGRTVLRQDELIESVHLPVRPASSGSAFRKIGRVAADISKVSAAVSLVREGDRVARCGIALGAVAPTPRRARSAEAALTGQRMTQRAAEAAVERVRAEIAPISDVRSSADYRRHVAGVIVRDALLDAWRQSGGGDVA